ncbi:hypothetical protein CXB49_07070 [Chromobacterium sp. ATCC 53434]|nr:hypothetical protein CXB49_07070 [Chromobacterium sp. ATCC 53434]
MLQIFERQHGLFERIFGYGGLFVFSGFCVEVQFLYCDRKQIGLLSKDKIPVFLRFIIDIECFVCVRL